MEGLFQPMHLLVIFLIALIIFGPKKLPELGKGIGEGFRALKDSMKESPVAPTVTTAPAPAPTTKQKAIISLRAPFLINRGRPSHLKELESKLKGTPKYDRISARRSQGRRRAAARNKPAHPRGRGKSGQNY